MPPKKDHLEVPTPTPPSATATAATPPDWTTSTPPGQTPQPLDEARERQLWEELRGVLRKVCTELTGRTERTQANEILTTLGLDVQLAPLLLVGYGESLELQATIDQGEGQAERAQAIRGELQCYTGLPAATVEQNRENADRRRTLEAEFVEAARKAEAATRATSSLKWLRLWLWPVFSDASPWETERNVYGESVIKNRGALAGLLPPPKTAKAAADMGLDVYRADSWRSFRKVEAAPTRRRYRSLAVSQPTSAPVTGLGRSLS